MTVLIFIEIRFRRLPRVFLTLHFFSLFVHRISEFLSLFYIIMFVLHLLDIPDNKLICARLSDIILKYLFTIDEKSIADISDNAIHRRCNIGYAQMWLILAVFKSHLENVLVKVDFGRVGTNICIFSLFHIICENWNSMIDFRSFHFQKHCLPLAQLMAISCRRWRNGHW